MTEEEIRHQLDSPIVSHSYVDVPPEYGVADAWSVKRIPTLMACLWCPGEVWYDPEAQGPDITTGVKDHAALWEF